MGPCAHREQQRVIGNRLVLYLLDRVPAPHALRLGLGTGKMSWIGQYGVGQRRGEMLTRAGSCELHERRAPFGPRDRPSGPLLRRRQVVTGIAPLPTETTMPAATGLFLDNKHHKPFPHT